MSYSEPVTLGSPPSQPAREARESVPWRKDLGTWDCLSERGPGEIPGSRVPRGGRLCSWLQIPLRGKHG